MDQFDKFLIPAERCNFEKYYIDQLMCYIRLEITEFMLNTQDTDSNKYYDLQQFFDKYKITSALIKNNITTGIFQELKDLGWHLATIFGDTGLIIMPSEDEIKKTIWASSFDFNIR